MDAQYPFASRDDIWRVFDELKELHIAQYEQGERLAQLERRRDDDARLRSPWCPVSPFPQSAGAIAPGSPPLPSSISSPLTKTSLSDPTFPSPPDAFKGFDQGHHSAMASSAVGFDAEDEPRRGASRANSVRFDESAIHGNGQASRSSNDLPLRTGSGLSTHPLLERTFSHQSDGRLSSSGHSHHSARTNSLRLNTTRLLGTTPIESPLIPPPGLFLLGPVPSIIRCWLTDTFTNGSLLYAAVCSGSYVSTLGLSMVREFGMENMIVRESDVQYIKLPLYLPEALIHPSSSRPGTPTHQVPTVTIRFVVREIDVGDGSIQIIIGSDVMRAHNADILFSQDKLIMVDDDHNRVSVPLVRPEKDSVFKSLCTYPGTSDSGVILGPPTNGNPSVGIIGRPANVPQKPASAPPSARLPGSENIDPHKSHLQNSQAHAHISAETRPASAHPPTPEPTKTEDMSCWSSWRRDPKRSTTTQKPADKREMKVFRTGKSASHANSTTSVSAPGSATAEQADKSSVPFTSVHHPTTPSDRHGTLNPVGGASAFGWLNSPHHNASS
ncbi:hypothetical protein E8E15_007653 [Penicillium rubens]|jgi:hypothetical protein|uniref:Ubiquitin carboxyl-terminal hydrolase 19 n=1 Tax=Penicillium chrysogenum TaxID=5076 RepID=A0A161ZJT2_PENCH|nr:uncharacterized protein N7525_003788 [Penicillium rubens]KAF3017692.1 hypothetical protein E8E15_007653 [Penicillium rubens]KAJ5045368.1 hypothetical protein NUH16_002185 [Penicillium rubens]KAJ5838600.1 hypothetical protein N7525_003788 [Penicillium rubens]KZN92617.1 hypothetical protein EN45_027760 [Penicillium chrysogenum]